MSIVAIDPNSVRAQSSDKKQASLTGVGFDDVLNAANPVATTTVGIATQAYQPAAVTNAAITGVASVPGTFSGNAPYYGGVGTSGWAPPAGGFGYGAAPMGNYSGVAGIAGANGIPGTPSTDYLEKQALFQQMNDANWEMLIAQVTVNEISRDWQARSNILKTKSDAEINAVRNLRS